MSEIGANLGAALAKAEVSAGHVVKTAPTPDNLQNVNNEMLHPVGIYFPMEEPNPDTGERRLTLDALSVQRGEVWFARMNPSNAFMVSESQFVSELRIHTIKLNPFTLNSEGVITSPGSLVMEIPGRWECPKCHKATRKISYTRLKRYQPNAGSKPRCQACPGSPTMVRIADPLRRPPSDHPVALELYKLFSEAQNPAETSYMVPRVWASYRLCDAPPEDAWQMDSHDLEGQHLEALSRSKFATYAGIEGTVIAVQPRGPEHGSGHRVTISPDGDAGMDSVVRSPVNGRVKDISTEAESGMITLYVLPDGCTDCVEACEQIELKAEDHENLSITVDEGDRIAEGAILAQPISWKTHDVDGRATLLVGEGSEVKENDPLSAGYTIRPVKLAMALKTPGIQALSMETPHTDDNQPTMKIGWLSWASMLGALTPDYGYTVYLAKERRRQVQQRGRTSRARV
jgi:hypothetical protein